MRVKCPLQTTEKTGVERSAPLISLLGVQRQDSSFMSDRRFKAGKQIPKVLCYQWRSIPEVSESCI